MKKLIISILFVVTLLNADRVLCPVCVEQGIKSIVHIGMSYCTAAFCGNGHYDEEGRFVAPQECNKCTVEYKCSNGHSFAK